MLDFVLQRAMQERNLSAREAARQAGVAHTTIIRILQHENVDLGTLKKICAWLEIDPMYAVNLEGGQVQKQWLWRLGMMIESNRVLHFSMRRIFAGIDKQDYPPKIIDDICMFIIFAMKTYKYEL